MQASILTTASVAPATRWRQRLVELVAVGGATPLLFPISWLVRKKLGLDDAELAVGFTTFYAAHVINDPHFTVTYLLFYKNVRTRVLGASYSLSQRARYVVAGLVVPLVLAIWSLSALVTKSAWSLGLLIQLMFFSVGWHYVKQGFGVLLVLAARHGVRFAPRERLALLVHALAGWAYAWASPYDPGRELEEKGVVYTSIAHPHGLERLTQIIVFATLVPVMFVLVRKRLREGRLPIMVPLVAFFSSIWAWSIYSSIDPLVRYVIPLMHSVQYLYMVWLLKRNEAREREGPPWFETSATVRVATLAITAVGLGWLFFHGAPTALDDMLVPRRAALRTNLGPTPYFAAIYAFVNIHHYVMDTVIWRRENPETRYLLR